MKTLENTGVVVCIYIYDICIYIYDMYIYIWYMYICICNICICNISKYIYIYVYIMYILYPTYWVHPDFFLKTFFLFAHIYVMETSKFNHSAWEDILQHHHKFACFKSPQMDGSKGIWAKGLFGEWEDHVDVWNTSPPNSTTNETLVEIRTLRSFLGDKTHTVATIYYIEYICEV